MNLTRKRHVSENGGPPPPPQRQHAALGHRRADAHAQLAVAQLPGLHFGPDQLQRADDRHGAHCHQNNTLQVNNNRKTTTGVFFFLPLTSGKPSGQKRNVATLEPQTEPQEVPQLVVAGEVDHGGWDGHHPSHTLKTYKETVFI